MKKIAIFLLILICCPVYAGFYSMDSDFDYIEPSKNLLYKSVAKVKNEREFDRDVILNIGIINLNSKEITYIFKNDFNQNIYGLYFETGIADGKVQFNNDNVARNNEGIKNREVKDKLCIYTYDKKKKTYSLWYCNKVGQNLKHVKSFKGNTSWWIDVKNSKIYFVRQVSDKLKIESIEW